MYALVTEDSRRPDDRADIVKKRKMLDNADITSYLIDPRRPTTNGRTVEEPIRNNKQNTDTDDKNKIVRILERRYPLTVTGYKYLNIGIVVKFPSEVNIVIGDIHGKEMSISSDNWRKLLEQKHAILSLLQCDENTGKHSSPMRIGNITLRFGRINNLPIMRVETPTTRLSLSRSTVLNMFNLEHCVNRLVSSLTAVTGSVDKKLHRLLELASTLTDSANVARSICENEAFDRNDIIDCELVALILGQV